MRILILSDDFPPQSFGGAGFSTFYLARGLQRAGHQVFVITTSQEKDFEENSDYEGLKIFRIFANYHERWRAYLSLYNPWVVGKIRKLIEEINPDIVHAQNIHYYLSFYCLKLAKKLGKPVFWTARDAMSFSYEKLATKRYLERLDCRTNFFDHLKQAKKRYNPLRNFLIKRYLRYPDKLFAVGRALKEALEANGIKNVEVSYTGIDVENWQITPEKVEGFKKKYDLSDNKIVFFGGRISGLKGLEQVKQAMVEVKKEIPEARLLIAGSEGVGWLNGEELKAAYLAADVVVVPSIYLDPFPRSNLEAMACKKPVIATCFGGSREVVQDGVTGFVVNPLKIDIFAEKIIDLLRYPEKAKQFGEAGYERIKKDFSINAQVAQTIFWYQAKEKKMKKAKMHLTERPLPLQRMLLLLDDKIIGKLEWRESAGHTAIEVFNMGVSEEQRNKGYATKMIERLEKIARKRKIASIYFWTQYDNIAAQKFYENNGYKEVKELTGYFFNRQFNENYKMFIKNLYFYEPR